MLRRKYLRMLLVTKQNKTIFVHVSRAPSYCCIMLMINHILWSNTSSGNIKSFSKLQSSACKLILSQAYTDIQEALERLNILSIDQIIFSQESKTNVESL